MFWVAPVAMAAIGALMAQKQQRAADKARKDQALINMYSPIFGQSPQALPARQDLTTQGAVSGGMAGYQIGQGLQQQDMQKNLYDKMLADSSNPNTSTPIPQVNYYGGAQSNVIQPWQQQSANDYFSNYRG